MEQALTIVNNNVSLMVHEPKPGTTCVDVRRAIANSGIMEKLTTIERSVFVASTAKVAKEYNDAELAAAMAETLKWVAKDIGVRDTASADWNITIVRICQIMKKYYEWFSVNDIRMAFELAVTGELNDYLPKDRHGNPDKDHYQMFNVDYFCKIVNAYKAYRAAVINKAATMVPKPVQERDHAKDAYYANESRKEAVAAFLYYKYRGRMPKLSPIGEMVVYNVFANVGLADEIQVTEQEQRHVLQRTLYDLSRKQRVFDHDRIEQQGIHAPEIQHPAYLMARYKALQRTFDTMVAEEIQVTEYITILDLKLNNGKD